MNRDKLKIIIFVFIIISIIGLFVIVYKNNQTQNNPLDTPNNPSNPQVNNTDYMIIDNNSIWQINNNNFLKLNNLNTNEKFNIYVNNKYFGKYNLKYGSVWNIFDDNNYVSYEGNILAYTTNNLNVKLKDIKIEYIDYNDYNYINQEINSIVLENDLYINEKVVIDIDNNGQNDEIVSVSNIEIGVDGEKTDKYFNLLYINFNGKKINLIKNNVDIKDLLIVPSYHIKYVLDINYKPSIIIEKVYFSEGGIENILYQYDNANFLLKI